MSTRLGLALAILAVAGAVFTVAPAFASPSANASIAFDALPKMTTDREVCSVRSAQRLTTP